MTDLRRPEPDRGALARLSERFRAWRASRFERVSNAGEDPPPADRGRAEDRPVLAITATAVATAAFTLVLLWGWQLWSERSSEPIDDRLPLLVAAGPAEATALPKSTADAPSGQPAADAMESIAADDPEDSSPTETTPPAPEAPAGYIVHVSGAVSAPGIVTLAAGDRVHDAIEAAGGLAAGADVDRLNLAAPVVDGERVHVPAVGEAEPELVPSIRPSPAPVTGGVVTPPAEATLVDLNRAGLAELETLPGVGPATAQAIIDTRDRRGPYYTIDDLLEVDGIGPAKLEELRPHVWVQDS